LGGGFISVDKISHPGLVLTGY